MLGKLIKFDFRSLGRILWPVQLCVLGATVLAILGMRFGFNDSVTELSIENNMMFVHAASTLVSTLMIMAIFASVFVVIFIILQRFYKSCLCDEGYLTFTLPTTTGRIIWSKLLTAIFWLLISWAVLFVCFLLFLAFGTTNVSFVNVKLLGQFFEFIGDFFAYEGGILVLPAFEFLLLAIVSSAASILSVYVALALGAVCAKEHKILAAIGFFFAISIVVSIITTAIQVSIGVNAMLYLNSLPAIVEGAAGYQSALAMVQPYLLYNILLSVALGAIYYVGTWLLLKNKLNLE